MEFTIELRPRPVGPSVYGRPPKNEWWWELQIGTGHAGWYTSLYRARLTLNQLHPKATVEITSATDHLVVGTLTGEL